MADPRDDRVDAAYRAMPGEAPPPALDAAIQAAARRAVGARPGGTRRWQLPMSIAAVLALAVGVSLQVEREKPMVVDGTPVSSGSAEYPVAPPAAEAEERSASGKPDATTTHPASTPVAAPEPAAPPAAAVRAPAATARPPAATVPAPAPVMREQAIAAPAQKLSQPGAPAPQAMDASPAPARQPVPAPEAKRFAPDPPRAEPVARPASPPAAAPPLASGAAPFSAPLGKNVAPMPAAAAPAAADAIRPAEPARAAAPPAPRAKSELSRDAATREEKATLGASEAPEKQLERIAGLRNRGMHDEADRALAQFRRDHPGYRISEEWLRKVAR